MTSKSTQFTKAKENLTDSDRQFRTGSLPRLCSTWCSFSFLGQLKWSPLFSNTFTSLIGPSSVLLPCWLQISTKPKHNRMPTLEMCWEHSYSQSFSLSSSSSGTSSLITSSNKEKWQPFSNWRSGATWCTVSGWLASSCRLTTQFKAWTLYWVRIAAATFTWCSAQPQS